VAADPYLIPGSETLRNLAGFTDPSALAAFEFEVTYTHGIQLRHQPVPGRYDLDHLRAFHQHLFQDVYDWAGRLRTVNIVKGNTPFAFANALVAASNVLFTELAGENLLRELDHNQFVNRAARYLTELNALHLFREGNGRTQRAFLSQLAIDVRWHLDWEPVTAEQNITASIASFAGNENAFAELLAPITTPLATPEHIDQTKPLRSIPPPPAD
jgi:cell filamentation protein